jgi:hypothetical protein
VSRSYTEMLTRDTFLSRYRYLALNGQVAEETFGSERWMNQQFYTSHEWKNARDVVLIRDNGCDLGVPGHEIFDRAIVHHINPITPQNLIDRDPVIFDPDNLILVSHNTHSAIHYGDEGMLPRPIIERRPGDTKLWSWRFGRRVPRERRPGRRASTGQAHLLRLSRD